MREPIPGFVDLTKLHDGRRSIVYRAFEGDPTGRPVPVILKILNEDFPPPEARARYQREFEIIRSLGFDEAIRAYALRPHLDTLMLVLEDFGGESVARVLERGRMSLEDALDIAV